MAPVPQVAVSLRLVLVRHGISSFNLEERIQGRDDLSCLTDTGREQARSCGLNLQEVPFTTAVSSPLSRARHTAEELLEAQGHGVTGCETLTPQDRAREALLMGLRLAEGVDPARVAVRAGLPMAAALDAGMVQACEEAGYLEWRGGRLCATAEGRMRLDAMLPRILL